MSDYFFYDMNKKMADLANKQQLAEDAQATPAKPAPNRLMEAAADYSAKKAAAGKDIGKPGKNFSKIAAGAAKRYGSAEAGKRVAGAVLNKLRHPTKEGMTDEGNAFSGAVAQAKKDGIQPGEKVRVGGKEYPLKEVDATPQHVDDWTPPAKPATKASSPKPPVAPAPVKPAPKKPAMYPPQAIDDPVKEGGAPMTPKQKKFASLAKPFDKITFADKIVGAKKEVDEMLGDVAANAMKKAVRGRNRGMEESWLDDEPTRRRSSSGGEIDTSQPGRTIHRAVKGAYSGAGHDASADDDPSGSVGRRKVGAGMGKKIGAKINRGTSKLMTREGDMPEDMIEPQDSGEYDQEGEMAKDSIKTVVRHAQALEKILGDNDNLPEWVQSKLAKIESMMSAVDDYMQNQQDDGGDEMEMDEESTTKRDNRAERAGRRVAKDIEYDEKKKDGIHGKRRGSEDDKAERAGKKVTKDIEYDEKKKDKKKKEVDETTSSGSVATSGAAPKSSGVSFGKGIYDSLNRQLENMISESMNINMSMNNDEHGGPKKSLTVTATDEDAMMLAGLLKMAGMGHGDEHIHAMTGDDSDMDALHNIDHMHGDEPCEECGQDTCECDSMGMMDETHGHGHGDVCPSCGASPCCCDTIEEAYGDTDATDNEPDWPTNEEGTDDAMMYSGGLNGPKSTGQTTVPVIAGQDDRMGYNGLDEELGRMLKIAGISGH